jgi:hypothetical protein
MSVTSFVHLISRRFNLGPQGADCREENIRVSCYWGSRVLPPVMLHFPVLLCPPAHHITQSASSLLVLPTTYQSEMGPYVFVALVGLENQRSSAVLKLLSLRGVLRQGVSVVGLAVGDGVGDGVGLAVGDGVGDAVGLAVGSALQGFWPCTYSPEPEKVPAGQAMHSPLASGTRSVSGWPELKNILAKLPGRVGVVTTSQMFQLVTSLTKAIASKNINAMSVTLETSQLPISWLNEDASLR